MSHPFTHPASSSLIKNIKSVFRNIPVYKKPDRHIIFLCGGSVKSYSRSLRYRFYKYAKKNLDQFRFFIAENATQDLSGDEEPEFLNIADFETFVANFTDCVLIILESPGSISEVSYFSNDQNILRKILVVNDISMQHDSFITLGPIDKVNEISYFKSQIFIDFNSPNFSAIVTRLQERLLRQRSTRFRFALKYFSNLKHKERLYVIFQLIYIFKVLTLDGIFYCIDNLFRGDIDKREIKHILSFLVASGYLKRIAADQSYFTVHQNIKPFLEFHKYDVSSLQIITADYFRKHHQESYELLKEIQDDN